MFIIEKVTDLVWTNSAQTNFKCNVKYEEFDEVFPCGVSATDKHAHIQALWANGIAGEYGPIAQYVAPPEPEPVVQQPQPTHTGAEEF